MRVLSVDRRRARWAREYLAVQLGIAQFLALGLVVIAYVQLPGAAHRHEGLAIGCAVVALAYAGIQGVVPARPSLMWLFPFGTASYIVVASVAVAATGGASSPVRVLLLFCVVYAAWFYETRPAAVILGSVLLATVLPLVYDGAAFSAQPLALTIAMLAVLIVGSVLTILGRSELAGMRDAARRDASLDPLTNLANRRALIRQLEKLSAGRRSSDRFGLVFLDLDHFKEINTEFGHAGGDAALRAVAASLRTASRSEDFVARLAGDEFAIVVPTISDEALNSLAERLVSAVEDAITADFVLRSAGMVVGASAGTAMWPDDAGDPDSLLHAADLALLAAKRAGRGCVVSARADSSLQRSAQSVS